MSSTVNSWFGWGKKPKEPEPLPMEEVKIEEVKVEEPINEKI